jgi:hypothetical protein
MLLNKGGPVFFIIQQELTMGMDTPWRVPTGFYIYFSSFPVKNIQMITFVKNTF